MLNGKSSKFFKIAPVCLMTWFTMGYVIPAQATIVADTTQNNVPGIRANENGSLTVNINAAKGGISHNKYVQFDSTKQGVILNNATAKTGSVLAGRDVAANANLGGKSASLIINEVTSNRASVLNGQIEVAGAKADVIVANPAGISCSGCGFINTGRGTLTTGTPKIVNNKLTGISVKGGKITIGENGMTDKSDYTDLLAQNIEIGGMVQAQQLQMMAGYSPNIIVDDNNQLVNTDNSPGVASGSIDVIGLGGMYANRISLKANGYDSGLNNSGIISSNSDIDIKTDGRITNKGSLVSNNGGVNIISSKGIIQTGILSSSGDMNIVAKDTLSNESNGTINSEGSITINADGVMNVASLIQGEDVSIVARNVWNKKGWDYNYGWGGISGKYGVAINATDIIDNFDGRIKSDQGSVSLISTGSGKDWSGLVSITDAEIRAKKNIYIEGKDASAQRIGGEGYPNGFVPFVVNGDLKAGNDITFNLQRLGYWTTGNKIEAGHDINITANDPRKNNTFKNEATFNAGNNINFNLKGMDVLNSGSMSAKNDVNLRTDGVLNNHGNIIANHDININTKRLVNDSSISSMDNLNIIANQGIDNLYYGVIKSKKITLTAPYVNNTGIISRPDSKNVLTDSYTN